MIGLQSIMALSQQFFPELAHTLSHVSVFEHAHSHGHSHGATDLGPNINAAWLAAGSIVVKEWLYRATMKVAKHKRSSVLASNAYHHRVDSLTSFVALLTIVASRFITNAAWLDPVGGMIISGMIIQAGWFNTKTALFELSDVGVDKEVVVKVERAATQALKDHSPTEGEIRGVQGVKSGQNIMMEIAVAAPVTWTVAKTEEVEAIIRAKVGDVRGVRRVAIRFSSAESDKPAFENEFVARQASEEEPEHGDHEHQHEHEHEHDHQEHNQTQANGIVQKRR